MSQEVCSRAPGEESDWAESKELWAFALSLGLREEDKNLLWLAQEAFSAPLPTGWTQQLSEEGCIFFANEAGESTWSHPADAVFRDVIALVKKIKAEQSGSSQEGQAAVMEGHLRSFWQHAQAQLDHWVGPCFVEGSEVSYYHNSLTGVSTWRNPVDDFENELALRQKLLQQCLMFDAQAAGGYGTASAGCSPATSRWRPPVLELSPLHATSSLPQSPPASCKSAQSFKTAYSSRSARCTPCNSPNMQDRGQFCLTFEDDEVPSVSDVSGTQEPTVKSASQLSFRSSETSKDLRLKELESAIRAFADGESPCPLSLELPPTLSAEERNWVKDFVKKLDSTPLKCESFGFGKERRLYLFRESSELSCNPMLQNAPVEEFTFGRTQSSKVPN